eukprot:GHVQ01022612.1.p1 GENE.GHVQ01022612.1~~GHVQ01022612.1.p1  ORF type:complete len:347 (-),score=69.86 GHVQ01022612.1:104-1144(-)
MSMQLSASSSSSFSMSVWICRLKGSYHYSSHYNSLSGITKQTNTPPTTLIGRRRCLSSNSDGVQRNRYELGCGDSYKAQSLYASVLASSPSLSSPSSMSNKCTNKFNSGGESIDRGKFGSHQSMGLFGEEGIVDAVMGSVGMQQHKMMSDAFKDRLWSYEVSPISMGVEGFSASSLLPWSWNVCCHPCHAPLMLYNQGLETEQPSASVKPNVYGDHRCLSSSSPSLSLPSLYKRSTMENISSADSSRDKLRFCKFMVKQEVVGVAEARLTRCPLTKLIKFVNGSSVGRTNGRRGEETNRMELRRDRGGKVRLRLLRINRKGEKYYKWRQSQVAIFHSRPLQPIHSR